MSGACLKRSLVSSKKPDLPKGYYKHDLPKDILYFVLLLYLSILFYFVSRTLLPWKSYKRSERSKKLKKDPEGEKATKLSKESSNNILTVWLGVGDSEKEP